MSKKTEKLAKEAIKSIEPAVSGLPSRLFGKQSPHVGHTYDSVYRFYKTKKDSEPCLTLRVNGTYRVPLLKLAAIILCAAAVMLTVLLTVRGALKTHRERRARKLFEEAAFRHRGADIGF